MAFEYAGSMYGGSTTPFLLNLQVGADCYVGQLVMNDHALGYGHILPAAVAAAGPDVTAGLVGVVVGAITSPTYTAATYQSDKITYDTTQATQVANDPVGAAEAQVAIMRPGDLWKAPIGKATIATALDVITVTTTDTAGDDVIHTGTITAPTHLLSTVYCRTGANKGLYRVITSGGTADQDLTICFPYDITSGDTFVAADVKLGSCRIDLSTNSLGLDASAATNYYDAFCTELNLEVSGEEYAVISFATHHIWDTR